MVRFEHRCNGCSLAAMEFAPDVPHFQVAMKIIQIPLLRDNYGYLIVCEKTQRAAIVDPSEADPVMRRVEQERVALEAILNTHHHRDHTGGNDGLLSRFPLKVYGH